MAHKSNWELINGRNFNWQVYPPPPPLIRTVIKDLAIFMQTFRIIALRDFMYYTYFGENQGKPWEGEGQFTPEIMYQNMTLPKC